MTPAPLAIADDPSILDDQRLARRVSIHQVIDGRVSPSAFSPSSQDRAISVILLGKDGTALDLPALPIDRRVVWFEVTAGIVRSVRLKAAGDLRPTVACGVARDPQPDNAAHALVGATANVSKSQLLKWLCQALADAATSVP